MKSYLKDILGINVDLQTWTQSNKLPVYLTANREFYLMTIYGVKSLVICVSAAEFQWTLFLRQKAELQSYCNHPIVLCFDRINSYQRKVLITSNQAFIVPENQIYMPFLGIALQERFKPSVEMKEQMTAMAQFILLYFWHQKERTFCSKLDVSKALHINLMNVSRGVQELEELGLLITKKKGRSSMVSLAKPKKESYKTAFSYLRSPVQKEIYVRASKEILALPVSGEEALFEKGFLERPKHLVRAVDKKYYNEHLKDLESVDPDWVSGEDIVQLQIWRYAPDLFDSTEVDLISFALSLGEQEVDDINMAIKQFLA